jgi:hypothetical protein
MKGDSAAMIGERRRQGDSLEGSDSAAMVGEHTPQGDMDRCKAESPRTTAV